MSENENLPSAPENINETKNCLYPGCENTILKTAQFEYCDTCRTIAARNAVALIIDPTNHTELERSREVTHTLLHNLSGDEILATFKKLENLYTEFGKVIRINNIQSSTRKPFKSLQEQIEEARSLNEQSSIAARRKRKEVEKSHDKRVASKDKKLEKMMKLTGGNREKAIEYLREIDPSFRPSDEPDEINDPFADLAK